MKRKFHILLVCCLALMGVAVPAYLSATERIEAVDGGCTARPVSGGIEISATEQTRVEIYSITGQQVKSLNIGPETITVDLPNGCYIVRTPRSSKKVVVR